MDYRVKYAGEKACATCKNVRSFVRSESIHDAEKLIPYDGGKHARCVTRSATHIVMSDEPRMDLPVGECWEEVI